LSQQLCTVTAHAQVAPLFSATWEAAASQQASLDGDAAAGTLGFARPAASLGATQYTQVWYCQ
jgi:hypothetical protein